MTRDSQLETRVLPAAAAAGALLLLLPSLAYAQGAAAERVGPNRQPRWTQQRAFPGPSLYVAPPHVLSAELRLDVRAPFDRLEALYELSLGLPYRFHVALKAAVDASAREPFAIDSVRLELRWALAPWDVIPWNPTLYLELQLPAQGPQKLEARLLLGGDISERWYWGGHFFWNRELWGASLTSTYGLTGSVSAWLVGRTVSVGGGYRIEATDLRDERFQARRLDLLLGPTLSVRPFEPLQLLLGAFGGPGLTRDDVAQPFAVNFAFRATAVASWRFSCARPAGSQDPESRVPSLESRAFDAR